MSKSSLQRAREDVISDAIWFIEKLKEGGQGDLKKELTEDQYDGLKDLAESVSEFKRIKKIVYQPEKPTQNV